MPVFQVNNVLNMVTTALHVSPESLTHLQTSPVLPRRLHSLDLLQVSHCLLMLTCLLVAVGGEIT